MHSVLDPGSVTLIQDLAHLRPTVPADPAITAGTAADFWINHPQIKQINAASVG